MTLDLIGAFSLYLVLAFVTGTALRGRNYRAMVGLVYSSAGRWPKLRVLAATHRAIFLRWPTVLPLTVTLVLTLANAVAAHFVWPYARVTPEDLWAHPVALANTAAAGGWMGFLDFWRCSCSTRSTGRRSSRSWTGRSTGWGRGRRPRCGS